METETLAKAAVPTGKEVLVVEDEIRMRDMLGRALKEMGFTTAFAASAEAANRAVAQKNFDILILDLNLPGMGGMEFLESVRRKNSDVQVIILTGFGDLEAARKAIHLDVVEFLTKPCALGNLEQALARAQKRRKAQFVTDAATAIAPMMQFDPPPATKSTFPPRDLGPADSMEHVEYQHILAILKKHNGNRAATAQELGISLRKLYYRLGEYQKLGLLPETLSYRTR